MSSHKGRLFKKASELRQQNAISESKGIDIESLRESPTLRALNDSRPVAPKEYPWQKSKARKLPRVVSVSASLTASEFARLAEESERYGVSLSELGREKVMAPIPFEDWLRSASEALSEREDDEKRLHEERLKRRRERRNLAQRAKMIAERDGRLLSEVRAEEESKLKEEKEKIQRELRGVASLQIRLTAYEATSIRWKAYCMKMPLSSYIRKMVLGYLPGFDDDLNVPWKSTSATKAGRAEMLKAVIDVCQTGRIPASTSLFYCKACAQVLSPAERS